MPNRQDTPIEIPEATIHGRNEWKAHDIKAPIFAKSFTFTASAPLSSDFLNKILNDAADNSGASWYKPDEKTDSETANLKYKAKQLLDHHYSVGRIINEFGQSKFPNNCKVICKCGHNIEHITEYFVHTIADHGNSLESAVRIFERILNKMTNTGW